MWFMVLLSWFSFLLQILLIILSLAAGLYYLTELVEEYTVIASKVIRGLIFICIFIQLALCLFEGFPLTITSFGLLAQIMHLLILKTFPYFSFTSFPFVSAVVLLVVNHYLAFSYFSKHYYTLSEVLGYFTTCVWMVPFAYFISLSANDYVLPTVNESMPLVSDADSDVVSHYFSRKSKKYGLSTFLNYLKETLLGPRTKKSF
ncbi:protein TEX261 [Brevipalpus obovatus]|uniref:protein TEX261 n=1 Tax=Brevipalpus obovatus TaxID=246614 RepID=UPI003D9DD1E5